jgi:hypothetical protein
MASDLTSDNLLLSETTFSPATALDDHQCASDLDRFDPKIRQFIAAAIAPNTRRAYASDLEHFFGWGGCMPAVPETIARYLADHAQVLSTATLGRR